MKKILLSLIMITIDILSLIGIFYLTIYVRNSIGGLQYFAFNELAIGKFIFVIFIILVLLSFEDIYITNYDFWQETRKVLKVLVLAFFIVLALLTLSKTSLEYSRLFMCIYFFFALLMMPIIKRLTKRILYRFSFFKQKVLVLGDKKQINVFKEELTDNWYLGMEYNDTKYDMVIISSQGLSVDEVNENIDTYLATKSRVYIVPYVTSINFANSEIMEYSNIRYSSIQIENKLLNTKNSWIKNLFEFFVVLLFLPIFALVHVIISILIRLDSKGMVLFKQQRLGKDGNDFICYKYRTMYENSDELLQDYLRNNPDELIHYEKYHKYKLDPRITKIGKILRATSLDELPQMINILKGDMGLVGPRPYMISESKKLGDAKNFILKVKPGITGLWQVSGRNNLTFKERIELDIWYIKNWSLWADFVIFVKTIKIVLAKTGAK